MVELQGSVGQQGCHELQVVLYPPRLRDRRWLGGIVRDDMLFAVAPQSIGKADLLPMCKLSHPSV